MRSGTFPSIQHCVHRDMDNIENHSLRGNNLLRKSRGTYFKHFCSYNSLSITSKGIIRISIVKFNPTTSGPWPREFLRYTTHSDTRNISYYRSEFPMFHSSIWKIRIDLIWYKKEVILFCDLYNLTNNILWIYHSRWIIWIDDENTRYFRMCYNLLAKISNIRIPVIFGSSR